jgi:diketogulonate reductase-like aldo/keto reductase
LLPWVYIVLIPPGIDTALLYGNQVEVGNAVKKSGVDRENIWITSKVS